MTAHEWLDSVAAYAVGALDEAERAPFEAHLAGCLVCQRELREMREVSGMLALAPRRVAPPPSLRDRIIADARAVRPITSAGGATARGASRETPPTTPAAPVRPITSAPTARTGGGRAIASGRAARWTWIAAVAGNAVAAAAVVAAVIFGAQLSREHAARVALAKADARTRATLAQREGMLAERDSVINALLSPDLETVALAATGKPPSARIYWNRARHKLVLAAFALPPAPAGRTYQLWGIAARGKPVSLGTFNTAPDGRTRVLVDIPADLEMRVSAVTEEPAGGSPQPTSQPFLAAKFTTE